MIRHATDTVWTFRTARFLVTLELQHLDGYEYDGDDEDGETQAKLNSGEYVAFDSLVTVYLDGEEIAADSLGGSVYSADDFREFYTAHRNADPMSRNCSIMRASHPAGPNVAICHYFPSMVLQAIRAARDVIRKRVEEAPCLRAS